MLNKLLAIGIGALAAWGSFQVAGSVPLFNDFFAQYTLFGNNIGWQLTCGLIGAIIGIIISKWMLDWFWHGINWIEFRLCRMPIVDIIAGAFGLIVGLIIANLVGAVFSHLPVVGYWLPIGAGLFLGYIGMIMAVNKREEIGGLFEAFPWLGRERGSKGAKGNNVYPHKILDTSVIIDGRIADICKSGFLEGVLIIPVFVLEELQKIADSSDLLKRNRGRRGLEMLDRIQKELGPYVHIDNRDFEELSEVDSKLVKLGQLIKAKIITNDYNLNKVAQIQGVPVLNINELANSVKPIMLPGEEMLVHVIKDGKEFGQGVAYLDDGTMIVVDGGKKHIGEMIGVMVTSVLQTAAGRMIFAKPKGLEQRAL